MKGRESQKGQNQLVSPIEAISSPVIPDSAPVKSETIPIKVRSTARTNSRIPGKDRTHSLSTFSTDSDIVSISSDGGISSGRTTPTASIAEDHPKSKSASGRKSPIQENGRKSAFLKCQKVLAR